MHCKIILEYGHAHLQVNFGIITPTQTNMLELLLLPGTRVAYTPHYGHSVRCATLSSLPRPCLLCLFLP